MKALADIKIVVIGLGYVGLPLAIEFAKNTVLSVSISTEYQNWKEDPIGPKKLI